MKGKTKRARAARARPAPPDRKAIAAQPDPEARERLRRVAATVDATVARLERLAAADVADYPSLVPTEAEWERCVLGPARAAAAEAWAALCEGLARAGHAALIAGGNLYYANAGRSGELDLLAMHEDVWRYAVNILRADDVLNLDLP